MAPPCLAATEHPLPPPGGPPPPPAPAPAPLFAGAVQVVRPAPKLSALPDGNGLQGGLQALVTQRVLTGFAILSVQGVVSDVVGPLAQDLGVGQVRCIHWRPLQQGTRTPSILTPS